MTTKQAPTAPWRSRIVGMEDVAPDQLLAHPLNWREHPGPQRDALRGSLSEVGWVQNVIVSKRTGFVVDGHARVEEALTRGESTVPVLYVDLDPDEEALVLATLDPIGAMATADDAKLRALLADISVDDAGLLALLGDLLPKEPAVGLTDPDEVPEVEETIIKRGDLFALGDHRLLCGDAVDPQDVARLLDGAQPRLLNTDPPYGVELDGSWRDGVYNGLDARVHGWGVTKGAEKPYMMASGAVGQPGPEDAPVAPAGRRGRTVGHRNTKISGDTRADWSEAFALVPSLQVGYVWYASAHTQEVLTGLLSIGFELAQQIIWDKTMFSIGRGWYHWEHEPCFVVRRPGVPNLFIGTDRTQSTMWRAPSPKRLGAGSTEAKQDHPTQKPVVLFETPIANHLRRGEACYEPFSGSGTTIIAAEQLGRHCYAIEIDPKYVQVAIERWQNFTGAKAVRLG